MLADRSANFFKGAALRLRTTTLATAKFSLASATRTATGVLAGLDLFDEEVDGDYIPGLTSRLSRITAHQLLTHTARLADEAPMFGLHDDSALGNGIRGWTDDRFFTEPGKTYSYSNPGYWMAGFLPSTCRGSLLRMR